MTTFGNHVPRSVIGRATAEDVLVGDHVIVPELALGEITELELPILLRIVDP